MPAIPLTVQQRFEACLMAGAIGDAWGSSFENVSTATDSSTFYLGGKPLLPQRWTITDDTQLTLATCEVLATGKFEPPLLMQKFVEYYRQQKLIGLGGSTLKAI